MATTSPTRIDDDLYAAAKLVGPLMSRSAAQQIAHWARIGRELEVSSAVSASAIGDVLVGARHYDDLTPREQAVVRAAWSERMTELRERLDLENKFEATGQTYAELDDEGRVVIHEPTPPTP